MARREKRTCKGFNRAIEDVKRQVEVESKGQEERWRSSGNKRINKVSLRSDRQPVLEENRDAQRQLFIAERDNQTLRTDLQKAREDIKRKEKLIGSLRYEMSVVQKRYDEDTVAWRELYDLHKKAKEDLAKRDEEITSLRQRLHAEIEETECLSTNETKESSEWRSVEERWQREVCHLKELLAEKDEQISRANEEQQALTNAHKATLDQLEDANLALRKFQPRCKALQVDLQWQLAERHKGHQRELSEAETEKNRQKPFVGVTTPREELSVSLCQSCEKGAELWREEKRKLEEMLTVKQKMWDHEEAELKKDLNLLLQENLQLQKFTMENKEKKSFWSWCFYT